MPQYRRAFQPGGTFFFTPVAFRRIPWFTQPAARVLMREAIERIRQDRPFQIDA